jgi:hypothetical protein
MQARLTRTSASVASTRLASGTLSMRTSPAPYMMVARMVDYSGWWLMGNGEAPIYML